MKRFLVFGLSLFAITSAYAQNIKTQVVVLGSNGAAVGAGFQAAVSGVNTTLVLGSPDWEIYPDMTNAESGIEGTLKNKIRETLPSGQEQTTVFTKEMLNLALNKWADSLQKLKVVKSAKWVKVDKVGNGWNLRLEDGRSIKADVLVVGVKENLGKVYVYQPTKAYTKIEEGNTLYRTSLAGTTINKEAHIASQYALIPEEYENLVLANADDADMAVGQAAGVVAAYGQFYGVKTSQTKLMGAQGEMLAYQQELIPTTDIPVSDKNWRAIQNILQTGILKLNYSDQGPIFNPDALVTVKEIDLPTRAYFYKAQLWMEDHAGAELTIHNAVNLMAYTRNKSPENTLSEVEKKWKTSYGFSTEFSKDKVITRREFAAIALDYFQLNQVNVDKKGAVIR